jgi:hypothetical protein
VPVTLNFVVAFTSSLCECRDLDLGGFSIRTIRLAYRHSLFENKSVISKRVPRPLLCIFSCLVILTIFVTLGTYTMCVKLSLRSSLCREFQSWTKDTKI